jgi:hypothetical protein
VKRFAPFFVFLGLVAAGLGGCLYYIAWANRECPIHNKIEKGLADPTVQQTPDGAGRSQEKNQIAPMQDIVPSGAPNKQTQEPNGGPNLREQFNNQRWLSRFLCETKLSDVALAFFTYALVLATGWLVWATLKLWRVTERSLTELETPFIALQVTETGLRCYWKGKENYRIEEAYNGINFDFVNYGRTAAVLLGMRDKLQICAKGEMPTLEWAADVPYPYGVLIGPEKSSAGSFRVFEDYASRDEFAEGKRDLFLVGRLRYRDIFNNGFEMGFCAVFDRATARFLMKGDDRYKYCRHTNGR